MSSEDESERFFSLQKTLIISLIILWLHFIWTRRHIYQFCFKHPCFWGFPLLGCVNRMTHPEDFIELIGNAIKEIGKNFATFWLGLWPNVVLTEPDLIEKVLTSPNCFEKATFIYEPLSYAVSNGLLTIEGYKWPLHRKLINPTFRQKILLSFFNIYNEELQATISDFHQLSKSKAKIGTYKIIRKHALNSVIKTTMGQKNENFDELYSEFFESVEKLQKPLLASIVLSAFRLRWLFFFNLNYQNHRHRIRKFVRKIVQQRLDSGDDEGTNPKQTQQNPNNDALSDQEDDEVSIKKPARVFIDEAVHLIRNGKLTLEEVANHATHIMIGGYETVGFTTLSALTFLAMHPEKQERLFNEILEVVPDKNSYISPSTLNRLPYLDRVVNEALRLAPGAPIFGRECRADAKLNDNITLPKGMQIMIDIFHLHRNKELWGEDAEEFRPERFETLTPSDLHPYAFIPFSKSSRDCIGKRYAMNFLKIFILGLVRNFKFSTEWKMEQLQFIQHIHTTYKKEPHLTIEPRQ